MERAIVVFQLHCSRCGSDFQHGKLFTSIADAARALDDLRPVGCFQCENATIPDGGRMTLLPALGQDFQAELVRVSGKQEV